MCYKQHMHCAYVGIVTNRGLELYYPEGEHTACFLAARLQRRQNPGAYCVWFVMEAGFDGVVAALLDAGHAAGAWAFVQDAARELGTLLPDGRLSTQFDERA